MDKGMGGYIVPYR